MKAIVFDLDDTLYDEYDYVRSGFRKVAAFLSTHLNVQTEEIYSWMWNRLQTHGRGAIFDDVLKEYGFYTKKIGHQCLMVYRMHLPNIILPEETKQVLERTKSFRRYIVTDGNKIVQHNKLKVLGLYNEMEHCYVTHRYGVRNAKPSPYCFLHILNKEKIEPHEIVYIGDNPRKDFVGIKPLGIQTIRVMTGQHRHVEMPKEFEADLRIKRLMGLLDVLESL
jgi:putative hydrolase of the HAD superfamily